MLSEDVISMLEKLSQFKYERRHAIATYFKNAEQEVTIEEDRYALRVIGGALSMGYNFEAGTYCPQMVLADGRRTFAMEDIDDNAVNILKDAAQAISPAWIKVQLNEIIWVKTMDRNYLNLAVAEFLEVFSDTFDENEWVDCFDTIRRAYRLSLKQGKRSDVFQKVRKAVGQAIRKMDGNDPLFLSVNLIELDYENAEKEELNTYLELAEKIFERHLSGAQKNELLAEATFELYCNLLKRAKRGSDIQTAKIKMAQYYEMRADIELSGKVLGAIHRVIILLQKACKLYDRTADKEKILEIRKHIEELQRESMKSMASIPYKFDPTPIFDSISKIFDGLSQQEIVIQFGRISKTYCKEDVKREVLNNGRKFLSASLFAHGIVDGYGRVVEMIPPLDLQDPESDTEVLNKHILKYIADTRSLTEGIMLVHAFEILQGTGEVPIESLNYLIDNNAIIPDDRKDIVKFGLHLGLNGNLYAAMHILLPQTENIIRNLVAACGDTVTFMNDNGCEEYKPLSKLLQSEKLAECYDENIVFTLQTLLDARVGPNLRNMNAHGLLDPNLGDSEIALCFLSFLIKFLTLYSVEASSILLRLIYEKKDVEDVEKE